MSRKALIGLVAVLLCAGVVGLSARADDKTETEKTKDLAYENLQLRAKLYDAREANDKLLAEVKDLKVKLAKATGTVSYTHLRAHET